MQPNVVLINCDDLGYGDLGCYGSTRNTTPALDRMAAEGLRLDSFYMASPVCSPSRGAMLTGCYPPRIGFGDFDGLPVLFPGQAVGLHPSEVSSGRLLSGRRVPHGRSSASGTAATSRRSCRPATGSTTTSGCPTATTWDARPARRPTSAGTSAATRRCRCCSTTRWSSSSPTRRRSPCATSPRPSASSARPPSDGRSSCTSPTCTCTCPIYVQERFARSSRNGAYGAAVETIDWVTAVLLHELRTAGSTTSTIVMFTSDNGSRARDGGEQRTAAGRPRGRRGRAACGCRASCAGPATWRPAGRATSSSPRSTCSPRWPRCAGPSCRPTGPSTDVDLIELLLDGAAHGRPATAFCYYRMNDLEAVRAGRWKLHVARAGAPVIELYDVVADPSESTDRAAERPDEVARLDGDRRGGPPVAGRRPSRHHG